MKTVKARKKGVAAILSELKEQKSKVAAILDQMKTQKGRIQELIDVVAKLCEFYDVYFHGLSNKNTWTFCVMV